MSYKTNLFLLLLVQYVVANQYKSSLTFVIDDTMSMHDDIVQVMEGANAIFDEVAKHEASQIENFIFLTFNDYDFDSALGYVKPAPGVKVRANTKDPKEFKDALQASLKLHGNYDCAEYAMSGIKRGLEISLPGSYIYVFTDASAKDYKMYEEIKRIAQQKQSQIVFVLTGRCDPEDYYDHWPEEAYKVYYDVANVASGEVFNIERDDVKKILEYVKISIQGRRRIIAQETLQPGTNEIEIRTDTMGNTVTISLTSENKFTSTLEIKGVEGTNLQPETLIYEDKVKLYKVNLPSPGLQKLNVYVSKKVEALVTALSGVTFKHGFSLHKPLSINSTTSRPLPDTKSYLSIKLVEGDIELRSVRLLGMDKKVMADREYPLELVNEETDFYTTEPFYPPDSMFWVEIVAFDPKTKTNLMRMSLTPVEVQNLLPGEKIENKPPSIVIEGDAKLNATYGKPLQLVCAVNGYPRPDIVWKNIKNGAILPGDISVYNIPYDYINVVTIDKVSENATYECTASNAYGSNAKEVTVETFRKSYFKILELPNNTDIKIEYEKEGKITCMVEAYPPAAITWYKNSKPLQAGANIEMNQNKSIITFKHVTLTDEGTYICEARNDDARNLIYKNVTITGVEPPIIDKDNDTVSVVIGQSTSLTCKLLKGKPKPSIRWFSVDPNVLNDGDEKELNEWRDKTSISIEKAVKLNAGTYRCLAGNELGSDEHKTELIVEYPPTIVADTRVKKVVNGSKTYIKCNVDGNPTPNVTWKKNGITIPKSDKFQMPAANILRLTVDLSDSGYYTCQATNNLGVASKTIKVKVYIPISIADPEETELTLSVGTDKLLQCEASGVPKPRITWIYSDFKQSKSSRKIIKPNVDGTILLERVQVNDEGYYNCVARNADEFKNLTYEVYVEVPPIVENLYKSKHFTAVEGDLALLIKCRATGNPKPTISWYKDNNNLALGSTYLFEDDTLIITEVPKDAEGVYRCEASNNIGFDYEVYEVTVLKYPTLGRPLIVNTEEGVPTQINCSIPHMKTDLLRWFRNGQLIKTGELKLTNPQMIDSGHYTCRVSSFIKSTSATVYLKVGTKPKFTTEEKETVLLEEPPISLICNARGTPWPKVTWYYNDEQLRSTKFVLELTAISSPGKYRCDVRNRYGNISRTFNTSPKNCYVRKDQLTTLKPLLLTPNLEWPSFQTTEKYILLPKEEEFTLYCPSTFKLFPNKYIKGLCDGEMILINGQKYNYADIECQEEITHTIIRTKDVCMPSTYGDTESVTIGFVLEKDLTMVEDSSIDVYYICVDKTNNVPIYAFHWMDNVLTDVDNKAPWSDSNEFPLNFEQLYDCDTQINTISSWLARWFHYEDRCCFAKRQLVNPRDVFPGVAQKSTYSYLNVVPQWGTCNGYNWEDVEQKVRDYVKGAFTQVLVWTGTAKKLHLDTKLSKQGKDDFFTDKHQNRQAISMFLWKVIQDPHTKSSLAIVQVNVPDVQIDKVKNYILCEDVCHKIDWMNVNNPDWHNIDKGYVYCCSVEEFKKSFDYDFDLFESDMTELLTSAADLALPGSDV